LHRLKSSSWYIAGSPMAHSCQLFEDLIRLEARAHWEEAMYELEDAFSQAYQTTDRGSIVNTASMLQAEAFSLSPIS